ncbi:MAG: LamG domain-containing protein, partial [Candidatus Moranbacteria bacterium]|nr:LamG domain-containing protein [Candidatus Moranbacteria bacterium]
FNNSAIINKLSYTKIIGLTITDYGGSGASSGGILLSNGVIIGAEAAHNLIYAEASGNNGTAISMAYYGSSSAKIYNNIIYNVYNGIRDARGDSNANRYTYVYNNTIINASNLAFSAVAYDIVAVNNIVQGSLDGYNGTFVASSNYNISDLVADAPGANSKNSTTVSFADAANKDFHLSLTDTAAKNAGASLYADPYFIFTSDIDGHLRSSASSPQGSEIWDIGADEAAAQIFYSVGQSVADLKTGTPTVTIASGVATFSAAQTGNIGVGDRVTYNTTDIAYIASKTSNSVWTLVTKTGAVPADITTSTVVSIKHEYTSLSAAVTGAVDANHLNATNLVTGNYQLNFPCYYDSAADTTAVNVTGYTTGVSNYIKIYTPASATTEANTSQRHQGRWDDVKYAISVAAEDSIKIVSDFVWVEGLQIDNHHNWGDHRCGVYVNTNAANTTDTKISNNIVRGSGTGVGYAGIYFLMGGSSRAKIWNNIVYDVNISGFAGGSSVKRVFVYNNTVYNAGVGTSSWGDVVVKNNIAKSFTASGFNAESNYNISSGATAPGANSKINTNVSFADTVGKDFHLNISDTTARNAGADLSADINFAFNTDIDGQVRPSALNTVWDIGADEGSTAIYRSIGPSATSALAVGTSNSLTIAGTTATFASALPDNIGVGDALQYDSDNNGSIDAIAFIHSRTSPTIFTIAKNNGTNPTATAAADSDWSIFRAYVSLVAAESVNENTGINTTIRNFDDWAGVQNLVTNNQQWNLAAYANGTTADAAGVTIISGWITSPANYIRIYTPTAASEVGTSQRHSGKWNENAYKIVQTSNTDYVYGIYNQQNYTVIDGLQIKKIATAGGSIIGVVNANYTIDLTLKNSIIAGEFSGTSATGIGANCSIRNCYMYNNIVYGFKNGLDSSFRGLDISQGANNNAYVYNNTLFDNYRGIYNYYANKGILKNNVANGNTFDYVTSFDASSSNNISQDATSPNVDFRNKTVSFADAANKDFHLAISDTVAKKTGLNLQTDTYLHFGEDIDGQGRAGNWDIGADEMQEAVMETQQSSPNLDAGLVGHWTFDGQDISSTIAKDISGNNNNGTINGATKAIGKLGQGLNYSVATNVVTIPDKDSLDGMAQLTLSAWINPRTSGVGTSYGRILEKGNSGLYNFYFVSNNVECDIGAVAAVTTTNPFVGKFNSWHHVDCVYDGVNISIYLDGVSVASAPKTGAVATGAAAFTIGNNVAGDRTFDGKIDDVRLYNRALSTNEISQLYHKGLVEVRETGTTVIHK